MRASCITRTPPGTTEHFSCSTLQLTRGNLATLGGVPAWRPGKPSPGLAKTGTDPFSIASGKLLMSWCPSRPNRRNAVSWPIFSG